MTERWSHDYEVTITRHVETVWIVNAQDEKAAEEEARGLDEVSNSLSGRGHWVKQSHEVTTEAREIA